MTDHKEAVAKGALLLDREVPDWWERVSVKELDMSDTCHCILGQLFEGFRFGAFSLFEDDDPKIVVRHGFDVNGEVDWAWSDLDTAWLAEIEKRRA